MPYVVCEVVREKQGPLEKTIAIKTVPGHKEFLEVPAAFVRNVGGKTVLPVALIGTDQARKTALIQLPFEADSGANRVWVSEDDLVEQNPQEVPA